MAPLVFNFFMLCYFCFNRKTIKNYVYHYFYRKINPVLTEKCQTQDMPLKIPKKCCVANVGNMLFCAGRHVADILKCHRWQIMFGQQCNVVSA